MFPTGMMCSSKNTVSSKNVCVICEVFSEKANNMEIMHWLAI